MRKIAIYIYALTLTNFGAIAAEPVQHRVLEAYPDFIQARIESRNRRALALPRLPDGVAPFSLIVEEPQKWKPGQTITVAFNGGTTALHRQIAIGASEWSKYANLVLDFGHDPSTNEYRTWAFTDTSYSADIRVSFQYDGFWSIVGTDSTNPQIVGPNIPSMNFEGFDNQLPWYWRGTVLHEFGHAIGAHHEHQHPTQGCDNEWRWDDDAGYVQTTGANGAFVTDAAGNRPGIYTVLGGPPNEWPISKVDHNLRQLKNSLAYSFGNFDVNSIMKYYFDAWMFKSGANSQCYNSTENDVLSEMDKQRIAQTYPIQSSDVLRIFSEREKFANVLDGLKEGTYFELRGDLDWAMNILRDQR